MTPYREAHPVEPSRPTWRDLLRDVVLLSPLLAVCLAPVACIALGITPGLAL